MSRKDCRAIAEIIKETREDFDTVDMYVSALVSKLSRYFQHNNVRFDSAKFRAACYGKGERDE